MYFSKFDSFHKAAKETAKSFELHITLKDTARTVKSSPIPIESLQEILEMVGIVEEQMGIMLWNHALNTLLYIPHTNISSISIEFITTRSR